MAAVERTRPKLVGGGASSQQGKVKVDEVGGEQTDALHNRISRLEALLLFEGELRSAQSVRELAFCIANETRKIIAAQQVYVLRPSRARPKQLQIDVVSNLSSVDRNAPAVRWLEGVFSEVLKQIGEDPVNFEIPAHDDANGVKFSFRQACFLPLRDMNGWFFAAVVFVNELPFSKVENSVLTRLQGAISHAWLALSPRPARRLNGMVRRALFLFLAALVAAAMFLPVPMTSLAPLEVVARSPQIIAAPLDGVIEKIQVEPNSPVRKGDLLFQFVDTELSSSHAIAKRSLNVARAKLQTAQQSSFGVGEGRRQMAVAKAELELAETELLYAANQLAMTRVYAPMSGLVVFDRKTDWQGRPVSVGERVVEIADPAHVEYRLDLPVSDAFLLRKGARVKVFLDSSPLDPKEALMRVASYRATLSAEDQLVYKSYAVASSLDEPAARIGARGTGQIFGERVTLGYYLFRRPISAMRQYLGW